MALRLLAATCLVAAMLAPAAQAHTAVYSDDDQVRGSVGLLNEPVSTYTVTGLDLCFTQNTTATPRPPVTGLDPGEFTATLHSPSGETFTAAVEVPFGRANCLTFEHPLVLTEPGQYLVDIRGEVAGSAFDVRGVKAGGEVIDRADITFPDKAVPSNADLREQVAQLQAEVDSLKAQDGEGIPAPTGALLMLGLVALVAVMRRA